MIDYSFSQETISRLSSDLNAKKENIIKDSLIKNGLVHLIEKIEKRRFPKICSVIQGDWEYYFADDDSERGKFLVAFHVVKPKYFHTDSRFFEAVLKVQFCDDESILPDHLK